MGIIVKEINQHLQFHFINIPHNANLLEFSIQQLLWLFSDFGFGVRSWCRPVRQMEYLVCSKVCRASDPTNTPSQILLTPVRPLHQIMEHTFTLGPLQICSNLFNQLWRRAVQCTVTPNTTPLGEVQIFSWIFLSRFWRLQYSKRMKGNNEKYD